jgi:uncharacterized Zn finger protein (UPF0148 family)
LIVCAYLIFRYYTRKNQGAADSESNNPASDEQPAAPLPTAPFPEGLDWQKVNSSFLAIQDAWQHKDLKNVRKWLSDGMYQRLTAQFKMMNALVQVNTLRNIKVIRISPCGSKNDGNYHTADIAITFTMDDSFTSAKYPKFNESSIAETATEIWTFIKRNDSKQGSNLYNNNNCPNCGAPFELKMGEISRCNYCKTLTNSAAFDWVLCEITQEDDYHAGIALKDEYYLRLLLKNDALFSAQRMEDIASNIFMQVMEAITVDKLKRLSRFADDATISRISKMKDQAPPFIFDRLYLNNVDLAGYNAEGNLVKLRFNLKATYRRVTIGDHLQMLDPDFISRPFKMELTRNIEVTGKTSSGETVYSYECSSCGAPYTDTTDDLCTYCYAPVVDTQLNWVLTSFEWA